MTLLHPQQSQILRLLRSESALSRRELHERTGLRPNTIGQHVAKLVEMGAVQEQLAASQGPGRPRVPLVIDPARLHVVGAAVWPHHVQACRINLLGQTLGQSQHRAVADPAKAITELADVLRETVNEQTYSAGISITGFMDRDTRRILFSSAMPGQQFMSLDELREATGSRPLMVDNDMRALAARWLQEHHQPLDEDVLLVYLDDGQLGAAMLIRGEPNDGCIVGGNELGHTRLAVDTDRCYCGHKGCMERICSTEFLNRQGDNDGSTLLQRTARFDGSDTRLKELIDLLATGLANPINFIRPHRVVLASQFIRYTPFAQDLLRAIRSRIMLELVNRVEFQLWDQAASAADATAGWLALAALYYPEWTKTKLPEAPLAETETKSLP